MPIRQFGVRKQWTQYRQIDCGGSLVTHALLCGIYKIFTTFGLYSRASCLGATARRHARAGGVLWAAKAPKTIRMPCRHRASDKLSDKYA